MKRVYEPPARGDGIRVLVDRLWPRGLSKEAAQVDLWMREIAPSPGLRVWFGHRPERFREFADRYRRELARSPAQEAFATLSLHAAHGRVTLLYGARDEAYNNAAVLKQELDATLGNSAAAR